MKRTALILLLMTAAVLAQPGRVIVGSWVNDSQNSVWTFRADGTGFMERGQPKTTARFSWQVQGNTLQVSTAGTSVPYQVVQCDSQTLVIRNDRVAQVYSMRRAQP